MMKYVLVILLINTYSCGWGSPVNISTSNGNVAITKLASDLLSIADHCPHEFITTQIKRKYMDCNIPLPPYEITQTNCLIFLDINRQLCNNPSLAISDIEFNTQLNEKIEVNKYCLAASTWPMANVPAHPEFGNFTKKIFEIPKRCSKVCANEDPMSDDTNYYCKYYKWGLDVIAKTHTELATIRKPDLPHSAKSDTGGQNNLEAPKPEKSTGSIMTLMTEVRGTNDLGSKVIGEPTNDQSNEGAVSNHEKVSQLSGPAPVSSAGNNPDQAALNTENRPAQQLPETLINPIKADTGLSMDPSIKIPALNQSTEQNNVGAQPSSVSPTVPKETSLDHPKVQPNPQDIAQEDFDDNGSELDDIKDDLNTSQDREIVDDLEEKISPEQVKQSSDKVVPPLTFNRETNQREFYPNGLPDDFTDNDDHFFSLFLTGVILVILLYVLYHNKSKVSKVVLGLIVEGRAGRRRNSRGHSYRRLDTLEQAVSTAHTAPPSKIIY